MTITELAPLDFWKGVGEKVYNLTGLTGVTFNAENKAIHPPAAFANKICAEIKANPSTSASICGMAHQSLSAMAKKKGKPIVEECDLNMIKIVVPVFKNGEFLGTTGGCGLLPEDEEEGVNTFLASKGLEKEEAEIESLAEGIGILSQDKIDAVIKLILLKLKEAGADEIKQD
ncbi:MAG: PocR ligand-binding domain-containing protein [bacterium]